MIYLPTKSIMHTKRRSTYKVLTEKAVIEADGPLGDPWTVYVSDHNGQFWLRPTPEMHDNDSNGNKRFISLEDSADKDAQILETLILDIDTGRPKKERWRHVQSLLRISQEDAIVLCLRFNLDPEKVVGDTP